MTLNQLKIHFKSELSTVFDQSEIEVFFYRLIEYKLQLSKIDVLLQSNVEIDSANGSFFKSAIQELQQEKPIQYIIGFTEFYGLTFNVNETTLIPRPETEELVDWILKDAAKTAAISILDIGTGSGCIPISLAKHLQQARVTTLDVSEKAIEIARENAEKNKVDITFLHEDVLTYSNVSQKYDIIVSNPPYVRHLEKQEIKKNVLAYEPHLALFVEDNNPLIFYRKITEFAAQVLTKNGVLYFEINQYLGKETVDLVKSYGFSSVELRQDLSGNDRMLKASI
jgi:release factor glutamine methyltransferase